jgi:hypothetical protein
MSSSFSKTIKALFLEDLSPICSMCVPDSKISCRGEEWAERTIPQTDFADGGILITHSDAQSINPAMNLTWL